MITHWEFVRETGCGNGSEKILSRIIYRERDRERLIFRPRLPDRDRRSLPPLASDFLEGDLSLSVLPPLALSPDRPRDADRAADRAPDRDRERDRLGEPDRDRRGGGERLRPPDRLRLRDRLLPESQSSRIFSISLTGLPLMSRPSSSSSARCISSSLS